MVSEVGEAPIVKFGCAAVLTVSAMVVVCVVEPAVPVMVTVAVPVVAVDEAVSVSVEVALLFAGGEAKQKLFSHDLQQLLPLRLDEIVLPREDDLRGP